MRLTLFIKKNNLGQKCLDKHEPRSVVHFGACGGVTATKRL